MFYRANWLVPFVETFLNRITLNLGELTIYLDLVNCFSTALNMDGSSSPI